MFTITIVLGLITGWFLFDTIRTIAAWRQVYKKRDYLDDKDIPYDGSVKFSDPYSQYRYYVTMEYIERFNKIVNKTTDFVACTRNDYTNLFDSIRALVPKLLYYSSVDVDGIFLDVSIRILGNINRQAKLKEIDNVENKEYDNMTNQVIKNFIKPLLRKRLNSEINIDEPTIESPKHVKSINKELLDIVEKTDVTNFMRDTELVNKVHYKTYKVDKTAEDKTDEENYDKVDVDKAANEVDVDKAANEDVDKLDKLDEDKADNEDVDKLDEDKADNEDVDKLDEDKAANEDVDKLDETDEDIDEPDKTDNEDEVDDEDENYDETYMKILDMKSIEDSLVRIISYFININID